MRPILSIIIPTKNRQQYCVQSIEQIIALNIPNIEICIQDNSDSDVLRSMIPSSIKDSIIYNYTPGIQSFISNFEAAVDLASGDYLCMIGDDDGILPSILDVAQYARDNRVDCVIPSLDIVYFWPSCPPIIPGAENGLLQITSREKVVKSINPKKELKKLLKSAIQDYTSFGVPRLYHGIVSRRCLDRIKDKTGHLFGGLTPDMYIATALSLVSESVISISEPITISGICPTSGSSDSASGKHTGELKDAPHFVGHASYEWSSIIPPFYSVDTIWADTLMHALDDLKMEEYKPLFNLSLFCRICLRRYPHYSSVVKSHLFRHKGYTSHSFLGVIRYKLLCMFNKVYQKTHSQKRVSVKGVDTILAACNIVDNLTKTTLS